MASYAHCDHCRKRFDAERLGTWARVTGWVVLRRQGGANAIREPKETGAYLCAQCGKLRGLETDEPQRAQRRGPEYCDDCDNVFTPGPGAWSYVEGWTVTRTPAVNGVRARVEVGRFRCPPCGKLRAQRVIPGQQSLV